MNDETKQAIKKEAREVYVTALEGLTKTFSFLAEKVDTHLKNFTSEDEK